MKSKTVQLASRSVEIVELPIGKFDGLLKGIGAIAKKVDLSDLNEQSILSSIPLIAGSAWNELLELVSYATGLEQDFIANECGMRDLVTIIDAVVEVNDIDFLAETIKKRLQKTGIQLSSTPSLAPTAGHQSKSSTK